MRYLSREWLWGLHDALSSAPTLADAAVERLVVEQRVTGGPDGEVTYHLLFGGSGGGAARPGPAEHPDVRFSTDYETAAAIAAADLPAQRALLDGRLRVEGDVRALLARARVLDDLDRALDRLRARTSF